MENTNNSVVISLQERIKALNPVDRVNELAATVLYDPKHVKSMTCYVAVRTYLTKVPGLNFVLESEAKRKWKISEILSETEKEKIGDRPIYLFTFDETTMTMTVLRSGDKKMKPIGLIEGHAVVLDTNMQYTLNAYKEYEDIEIGMWKWYTKVQKEVFGYDPTKPEEDAGFFENLKRQQIANFKGMHYEERINKLLLKEKPEDPVQVTQLINTYVTEPVLAVKKEIVNDDKNLTFIENLKNKQIENFKKQEYGKIIDSVLGEERSFESFKTQQIANFKGMEYEKKFAKILKPRETIWDYKGKKFPLKFNKKEFKYEELSDLLEAFPNDFVDDYGVWCKNSLLSIYITFEGKKVLFTHAPRNIFLEYIHYQQADGKVVYAFEGDFVAIEKCDVHYDEIQQILSFEKELNKIKMYHRYLARKRIYESLLISAKDLIRQQNQQKINERIKILKRAGLIYRENLKIQEEKRLEEEKLKEEEKIRQQKEAIQKQLEIERLEREKQIRQKEEKILNQLKENEKRPKIPLHKLKEIICSFKSLEEKNNILKVFGFEYATNQGILVDAFKDPQFYKECFIKKTLGYILNLNHPDVANIIIQNDGTTSFEVDGIF